MSILSHEWESEGLAMVGAKCASFAQGAPCWRKVCLLRKRVRLCTNVHRCAPMFVVACKVFPLHWGLNMETRELEILNKARREAAHCDMAHENKSKRD